MANRAVGIVGLGYVGLSTASCFVSKGIRVVGVDVEPERVSSLSRGVVPILEDGVAPRIKKALSAGLISFHDSYDSLVPCGIVFLAVGTPGLPDGSIDTRYVEAAAAAVGTRLGKMGRYPVVVVKSTVTPSTTRTKVLPVLARESGLRCGKDFGLATNPEFLREGKAFWDMMHPDAIVIGRVDQKSVSVLKSLYEKVYRRMPPLLVTDSVNAEFVKYAVNSIRAVQLSYINTLANICSRNEGAEIDEVVKGLRLVARIDERYSRAGLGFGGSCLIKDTNALVSFARSLGVDESLLSTSVRVNQKQANQAITLAEDLIGPLKGKRVAVLGLTFKADTDDTRESVGLRLTNALASNGAEVVAFDPGYSPPKGAANHFRLAKSTLDCLASADCCIVTNEWQEFKDITPAMFRRAMKRPVVIDGRGLYDPKEFARAKVPLRRIGMGMSRERPGSLV